MLNVIKCWLWGHIWDITREITYTNKAGKTTDLHYYCISCKKYRSIL